MFGGAPLSHQADQMCDEDVSRDAARRMEQQGLAGELIDDGQDLHRPSIFGPIMKEIEAPDVIGSLGRMSFRAVGRLPYSSSLALHLRHSQPFLPPTLGNTLDVDPPALTPQQVGDPAVAEPRMLLREFPDVSNEPLFIILALSPVSLRRTRLMTCPASSPLRNGEATPKMSNRATPTHRAQKFPFASSLSICLSRLRSATNFLSWLFSFSSSFSRFT